MLLCLGTLLAAGCGRSDAPVVTTSEPGLHFWPFESGGTELDRRPKNAVEYRCAGSKGFYLRKLGDDSVWLIAPDREIRLDKQADGRYGVGRVSLELSDTGATLTDPPTSLVGCTRADGAKK